MELDNGVVRLDDWEQTALSVTADGIPAETIEAVWHVAVADVNERLSQLRTELGPLPVRVIREIGEAIQGRISPEITAYKGLARRRRRLNRMADTVRGIDFETIQNS